MVSIYGASIENRNNRIIYGWGIRLEDRNTPNYWRYLELFSFNPEQASGDAIIDYGCGPFGGVLPLLNSAKRRVGVDVLMETYEKFDLLRNETGVEMVKCDMGDARWTNEFNHAFCVNALDHGVDDSMPEKALWAIYQALVPGGKLYLHFHERTPEQLNLMHLYSVNVPWLLEMADVIGFKVEKLDVFLSDPLNLVNTKDYKTIVGVLGK